MAIFENKMLNKMKMKALEKVLALEEEFSTMQ